MLRGAIAAALVLVLAHPVFADAPPGRYQVDYDGEESIAAMGVGSCGKKGTDALQGFTYLDILYVGPTKPMSVNDKPWEMLTTGKHFVSAERTIAGGGALIVQITRNEKTAVAWVFAFWADDKRVVCADARRFKGTYSRPAPP